MINLLLMDGQYSFSVGAVPKDATLNNPMFVARPEHTPLGNYDVGIKGIGECLLIHPTFAIYRLMLNDISSDHGNSLSYSLHSGSSV
jgi:hypothetical protein